MQTTIAPIQQQATSPNVRDSERVASALAGGALAFYGLRSAPERLPALLAGGYLLYRGLSGRCTVYQSLGINSEEQIAHPAHIEHTITISAEPARVYQIWRNFANLPSFMRHLEEVQVIDDTRSRWVARGPVGSQVSWDATIFMERENELIAWRSDTDAQIVNAGSVRFTPAPGDRGTEVRVIIEYMPPAGALGQAAARLLREEPDKQVIDDLRRLKMMLEAGEIATNAMRPEEVK